MLANRYQDYMFGLLKKVIDEIGPRPPCSEAEKKLGRLLVEEWKPICDRVDVEPFICSPTAAVGSYYILALLYFASIILYWFFPPLALALAAINCAIAFLEGFRLREFVDFLFPRKQGENVIGAIQPKGERTQRVIVSAHMDSQYEWNHWYYLKDFAVLVQMSAVVALLLAFAGSLAKTIAYFNVFSSPGALNGIGIAMIALSPIAVLFLFYTSWKPVPGATDNMSGVAVVAGLGKYLEEAKRNRGRFPERTEVVLLATSSEEAALRGAKRYVKRHLEELRATPTYVLNLDGIMDEKFLAVLRREFFNGAIHDPSLVKMAQEVAASYHWPMAAVTMPIPGGTDTAHFSKNRIPAISIYCMDTSRILPNVHTRNDTYDYVRPESLSVSLQLVIDMIQRIDEKQKT